MVALAWQMMKNQECPGCHQPWHETTNPDAYDGYDAEAIVCFSCSEREREIERFRENKDGPPPGLYVTVKKRS